VDGPPAIGAWTIGKRLGTGTICDRVVMASRSHAGPDDLAARILACVESIPPGRVMTYGDVAEYVGARSARTVGRVLALDDGSVPWHRVLRANGSLAEHLYPEQRQRLLAEGVRFTGHRVELAAFRWDGRPSA
jgi:methylated-DNA-protein-cysteine methyltransferase-like protein